MPAVSVRESILQAVKARIEQVLAPACPIHVFKVVNATRPAKSLGLPSILIGGIGSKPHQPWSNVRSKVGYPTLIAYIRAGGQDQDEARDDSLLIGEQLARMFIDHALPGANTSVATVYNAVSGGLADFDPSLFLAGYDAIANIVVFESLETRTVP